jgi:O-antigen ligase
MKAIVETGLIAGMVVSVVFWGGAEMVAFGAVETLLFAVALAVVLSPSRARRAIPLGVPALLMGWPSLALVPLPAGVFRALGDTRPASAASGWMHASLLPHATELAWLQWMACLTAFCLVLEIAERGESLQRLVLALVLLGGAESIFGIAQFLTGWQPLARFLPREDLQPLGTYINRDHFAGLLEMIFPFVLAWTFEKTRGAERSPQRMLPSSLRRLLVSPQAGWLAGGLFLSALFVVALISSASRMGIFSGLVGAAVVCFLWLSSSRRRRSEGMLVLGFLGIVTLLSLWVGIGPALTRYAAPHPLAERWSMWANAVHVVRQSPVLGTGLGTLAVAVTPFQSAFVDRVFDHAHNDYLEFAAELGLPGALLLFAAIFRIFGKSVRAVYDPGRRTPRFIALGAAGSLLAILGHSLVDFNLHLPANALVFAVVLALAYSTAEPSLQAA